MKFKKKELLDQQEIEKIKRETIDEFVSSFNFECLFQESQDLGILKYVPIGTFIISIIILIKLF